MTSLAFVGVLPTSLVAFSISPMVLVMFCHIVLNTVKNTRQACRTIFTMIYNLLARQIAHMEAIHVTMCFNWVLGTLEFIATATGGGYEMITEVAHVR